MKHHHSLALWITLACAAALAFRAPAAQAADSKAAGSILYVAPGGAAAGNCDSWAAACDLQYALAVKAQAGDELWVKAGTYTPAAGVNRMATFRLRSGIALYGGFAGDETSRAERDFKANETILSGEMGLPGNNSDNACHVVTGSGTDITAVLDGFTITAGNASAALGFDNYGGGMFNLGGSPAVANVIFRGNWAGNGGGMSNQGNSSPTLSNVTFSSNSAFAGGGIYNQGNSSPTLSNVTFSDNSANSGGGMYNIMASSPTLSNVTFSDNSAIMGDGGALYSFDSSPAVNSSTALSNVTFSGNEATMGSGGGMYITNQSPTLSNVTFSDNSASNMGGGIYSYNSSLTLKDVTFNRNTAETNGGGLYKNSGSPVLENVTFSDNSAGSGGGIYNYGGDLSLVKVTFSKNSAVMVGGGMANSDSSPTLTGVTFLNNSAGSGGGMFNSDSSPTLTGVTFSGNSADFGGGMHNIFGSPDLKNVTFSGNTAKTMSGGIDHFEGDLSLVNVTFSGNIAGTTGGGLSIRGTGNVTVHNAIFWSNTPPQINNGGVTSASLSHSLVEGGCPQDVTCANLLTGNPLLGQLGDYGGATHTLPLLPGSPAIDAGDAGLCPDADQRGISRPQGAGCDIGAYESRGFTLAKTGGDNQRTYVGTTFAEPITLSVSSAYGEPVDGGLISMLVQPSAGAGAAPENSSLVISEGVVSQSLAANGVPGSYTVSMNTPGAAAPQTFTLTNTRWSTSVTLLSSANPAVFGEPVTFTATVAALPPGSGLPSGTVLFKAGGRDLGAPVALVDGRAIFTAAGLETGEHSITAEYSGDVDFDASTSAEYVQTVSPKIYAIYLPFLSAQP